MQDFSADFFADNRRRLCARIKNGLIFIAANGAVQKTADESFPFRQDSSFWYLCGINEPDAVLVIDAGSGHSRLLLPPRAVHRDAWDGAIDASALARESAVDEIHSWHDGWRAVKSAVNPDVQLYMLMPADRRLRAVYGIHPNPARQRLYKKLRTTFNGTEIHDCRSDIKDLRIIKQPIEIEAIRQAIHYTEQALRQVAADRPVLQHEATAEAAFDAALRLAGAAGTGFDTIVAGGKHAATMHYRANNQPVAASDMVLIDAGARYGLYNADITRMFSPRQGMQPRQQQLFDAVQRVQQYAYTLIRPGESQQHYEQQVAEAMGRELQELGLVHDTSSAAVRRYFPTLCSHHLGLDVHDIANRDERFAPGMVLTVEPGIYIPEEGIGIRIEDDILITEQGIEILTSSLPPLL